MNYVAADLKPVILIPAYQPGQALIKTTDLLQDLTVVVVDDGSGADYRNVFAALGANVHVVHHATNKGKGAALKTGYRYIRSTFQHYIVVTADADGQHHVDDIKQMIQTYRLHPHTLLLGARTFESNAVPFKSKFGNVLTRNVLSLIMKQGLHDTQTGLRVFDESLTDFMLSVPGERFEYETNVLLACSKEGVDIVESPIQTIYLHNNQSSHFDPIKDSWAIYKEIFKFASSSLLAFVIDYSMFIVLLQLTGSWGLASSVAIANIVARITSASVNFTINRRLVFRHNDSFVKGFVQYSLLAGGVLLGNTIMLTSLIGVMNLAPYIAKIVTELTFFCISYIVQKNIVFAQKRTYQV